MTSLTATPSADPIVRRIARVLGWLCVFATLALLSPGVVATARADETAGPSCPLNREGDEGTVAGLERMVERLRAETSERGDVAGEVVSLNTRGYNYATPAAPPEPRPDSR